MARTRKKHCLSLRNRSEKSPDQATNEIKFLIRIYISILSQPIGLILQKNGNESCFSGGIKYEKGSGLKISNLIGEISKMLGGELPQSITEYTDATVQKLTITYKYNGTNKEDIKKKDKNTEFKFGITIDDIFNFGTFLSLKELDLDISKSNSDPIELQTHATVKICETDLLLTLITGKENKFFQGTLKKTNITIKDILIDLGINNTESIPDAILNFEINQIDIKYELREEKNLTVTIITNYGKVTTEVKSNKSWSLTYETKNNKDENLLDLDVLKIPVAGELVKTIDPTIKNTSINDFKVTVSSDNGVNIILGCNVFGTACDVTFPLSKPAPTTTQQLQIEQNMLLKNSSSSGPAFNGTAVWKKFDKPITILILTIPKIGFGLDNNGNIAILLDASLNVSPLTFSLNGAGIGVNLSKLKDINFYLSGFAISFDNGVLSIGGGFYVSKDEQNEHPEYIGELAIRFKEIGLTAIGSYSAGSMWAYLVLSAPIGGIPAFFVKGLAAGFGYNRRLNLPSIEDVKDYPLITAAQKGSAGSDIIGQLEENHYIEKEDGQYFLAAGIKFTSFQIINGFILATVSFGNDCELGLLGLADITVPPNVSDETKCLAKAQLAISASVKPLEGEFKAEAQLTNESYILTKECKLTGGFAAYAWFGENKHSGDFVVSLGGYHPSFNKPDHYPDVPRLGLNWQVNKNISIVGEMYFALTPSCLMAGGKLSATYTQGDLKAWFIAYANMIMNWKPFWYDLSIGVTLGASYTVEFLFVKNTFSVEMEANLYLQGPKLHGKIDVSWYIISFTIEFGDEPQKEELSWDDFIDSFFVEQKTSSNKILNANKENEQYDIDPRSESILTISLEGVVGKIEDNEKTKDVISARQLEISALSKIPIGESINVRPLLEGHDTVNSTIEVHVMRENGEEINNFNSNQINQKLPAALWGDKKSDVLTSENSLVKLVCGKKQSIIKAEPALFPSNENRWITLQELYEKNKILYGACFAFFAIDENFSLSYNEKTIEEFTENEKNINAGNRDSYITSMLQKYGVDILEEHVSITKFAEKADSLLSENIMIIDVEGEKWYEPRRETI